MSLFPSLRRRQPSQPMTGANVRIAMGIFGESSPYSGSSFDVNPYAAASIYHYHEGNLFTPGTGNFVFEPNFELPLVTVWGKGFIRNPNTFKVTQPPQVWSHPHVRTNGIGGLQAGEMELQPLIEG